MKLATDCSLFISQVALPSTIECQAALERGDRRVGELGELLLCRFDLLFELDLPKNGLQLADGR